MAHYSWTYDSVGRPLAYGSIGSGQPAVWYFTLGSGAVESSSVDGTVSYRYDARGQLIAADYDYQADENYTYDANGNRTNAGYVTGDHNRLLSDGTYNYEYDPEGNRIRQTEIASGRVTEYRWDHRNRLVSVVERASPDGPVLESVEYVYDARDRWIGRSVDADGEGLQEATGTQFVYDGNQIVLELDGEGTVTHRYLWGPAVDQILADEQVEPDGSIAVLWTLTDHLNTVRDVARLDEATGVTTVVNHLTYDAFGNVTGESDRSIRTLFRFTARPYDEATGLQNNLHRWYDAKVGRWLSEDPIGFEAGDANLYRYAANQPTQFTDPSGEVLWPVVPIVILAWWALTPDNSHAPRNQADLDAIPALDDERQQENLDITITIVSGAAGGAPGLASELAEEATGVPMINPKNLLTGGVSETLDAAGDRYRKKALGEFERGPGGARKHTPGHRPEHIKQQAKAQDAATRARHQSATEAKMDAVRQKWENLSEQQRKLLKGVRGVDPEATRPVDLQ